MVLFVFFQHGILYFNLHVNMTSSKITLHAIQQIQYPIYCAMAEELLRPFCFLSIIIAHGYI